MKTSLENIAAIIAAAIWADGVYDPAEEITVEEIAEALELDEAKFKAAVNKCVKGLNGLSENQANARDRNCIRSCNANASRRQRTESCRG